MPHDFIIESYDRLSEWLASCVPALSAFPNQLQYVLIYLDNIMITITRSKAAARNLSQEVYNGFGLSSIAWTCE